MKCDVQSKSEGKWTNPTVLIADASNGDPDSVDLIVYYNGVETERHENVALDLEHPSVPQWLRDAAEKERMEMEAENAD